MKTTFKVLVGIAMAAALVFGANYLSKEINTASPTIVIMGDPGGGGIGGG